MKYSRVFPRYNQLLQAMFVIAVYSLFLVSNAAGCQTTKSPQPVPIVAIPNMESLPDGKIIWKRQLATSSTVHFITI